MKVGINGYKSNTIEPRLACLFEGVEKESEGSKRNRLVGKHYFAGVYKKLEDIWLEVLEYIDAVYDEVDLRKLKIALLENPTAGTGISGGMRKYRHPFGDGGKSGGSRVIY